VAFFGGQKSFGCNFGVVTVKRLWTPSPDDLDQPLQEQWFSFANVVSPGESRDDEDAPLWYSFEWVQEFGTAPWEPRAGERPIWKTVVTDARADRGRGAGPARAKVPLPGPIRWRRSPMALRSTLTVPARKP
jgi:hypothetical protein